MSDLINIWHAKGKVSLIDKINHETDPVVLDAMRRSCLQRQRQITPDEMQAFARKRAELMKGKS